MFIHVLILRVFLFAGHVVNMWRFDTNQQRLFVSRSLLFTDLMKFTELQNILQTM